ncbi:MAG: hypothetical protein ACR2NW_03015 [Thermodesulfobacteriota bacterium]
MSEAPFERRTFDRQLVTKAIKDPGFRRKLLVSPKETYLEELRAIRPNQTIPDEAEITILEEKGNMFYVVIPEVPQDLQLSDESLADIVDRVKTHRFPCWGLGDAPADNKK